MSKSLQEKVLETINSRIDGLDLLKLIDYRPDTIQEMGTTIKCFCPIHKERVFKSLLLDNKKKIIKCAFKSCRGFDGGTFVDLYAIIFNLSTYNAAIEISKKLNLNIDTNIFSLATSELFQSAKKLYEDGKVEEAIKKCIEARDMDASNLDTTRLLIDAYRSLNKKEELAQEYLILSKSLLNKNDFNSAITTLKELSEIDCIINHNIFEELVTKYNSMIGEMKKLEESIKEQDVTRLKSEIEGRIEHSNKEIQEITTEIERNKRQIEKLEVSAQERKASLEIELIKLIGSKATITLN